MKSIVLYQHEVKAVLDKGQALILRPIKFRRPAYTLPGDLAACELASFDGFEVQFKDKISRMVPIKFPYGRTGDLLYAKETWAPYDDCGAVWFRAGVPEYRAARRVGWLDFPYRLDGFIAPPDDLLWRSPVTMAQWASRVTLRVAGVRVKRVQDVCEADAQSAGVGEARMEVGFDSPLFWVDDRKSGGESGHETARAALALLWDSIHAKRGFGWEINPWVWAVTAVMEDV
jgi:hypothetical protein